MGNGYYHPVLSKTHHVVSFLQHVFVHCYQTPIPSWELNHKQMRSYNLDNKAFVTTGNEQGLANADTLFRYFQNGDIITGRYRGGHIKEGLIVGKQTGPAQIELLYQCITIANELKCGQSKGIITEDENGKLILNFDWNWLNSEGSGQSFYKEVNK